MRFMLKSPTRVYFSFTNPSVNTVPIFLFIPPSTLSTFILYPVCIFLNMRRCLLVLFMTNRTWRAHNHLNSPIFKGVTSGDWALRSVQRGEYSRRTIVQIVTVYFAWSVVLASHWSNSDLAWPAWQWIIHKNVKSKLRSAVSCRPQWNIF